MNAYARDRARAHKNTDARAWVPARARGSLRERARTPARARRYFFLKRWDDALPAFRAAYAMDPKDISIVRNMAGALEKMHRTG